jgi:hypothetical protein
MTPDALKIATDILRELGLEDVARWVEHPDAVRELLRSAWGASRSGDDVCGDANCHVFLDETHMRTCRVPAAWRALGDPRGQADIERAHEEAIHHQTNILAVEVSAHNRAMTGLTPEQINGLYGEAYGPIRLDGLTPEEQRRLYGARIDAMGSRITAQANASALTFRAASDARGMDAVEYEARTLHAVKRVAAPIRDAAASLFPPTM